MQQLANTRGNANQILLQLILDSFVAGVCTAWVPTNLLVAASVNDAPENALRSSGRYSETALS